ncbi:MAG: metal-dependent transcriptional regulator [Slackia sp.]
MEQPYYGDITLTEKGRSYGEALWRRHNLYRFLAEVIGIDQQTANYEACQMEHAISEDSFMKWEAYLSSVGIKPRKA